MYMIGKTFTSARFFSGGGGSKPKPPPAPEKPKETQRKETQRIVDRAGESKEQERKRRIPPGRKSTIFAGIEKALKSRLGE